MALKLVDAAVTFKSKDCNVVAWARLVGKNGVYQVADNDCNKSLTAFCLALLDGLSQTRQFNPDNPLKGSLDSSQIEITPVSPTLPGCVTPPREPMLIMPPAVSSAPVSWRKAPGQLRPVVFDDSGRIDYRHLGKLSLPLLRQLQILVTCRQCCQATAHPDLPSRHPNPALGVAQCSCCDPYQPTMSRQ